MRASLSKIDRNRIARREVKVCPVVIRTGRRGTGCFYPENSGQQDFAQKNSALSVNARSGIELLLFRHPIAGVQLVKGTLELWDESIEAATVRELEEESGIPVKTISSTSILGQWESGFQNQQWHFVLCDGEEKALPDTWSHYTLDDGGHWFEFFWYELESEPQWKAHPVFIEAISQIRQLLLTS